VTDLIIGCFLGGGVLTILGIIFSEMFDL